MGGSYDAHVHFLRSYAAQAFEFTLLQYAQQLGLQLQRNITDLIQEECALISQLEATDPLRDRAGEGAPFVSEDLAFQQTAGNGRTVEFDERSILARTAAVDRASNELLPRSCLAQTKAVESPPATVSIMRMTSRRAPLVPTSSANAASALASG
jgi:hypothetical protein